MSTFMHRRRLLLTGLSVPAAILASRSARAQPAAPAATVLLIRHAATDPGIGDPPGFRLGECGTQRNLSADGREQARRLGRQLEQRKLVPIRVRTSAWCRCIDTAQLAFGTGEVWPALNSFFDEATRREEQTAALRSTLAQMPLGRVEAWITHQVNITALTGENAAMGEVLVLRVGTGGEAAVIDRLRS